MSDVHGLLADDPPGISAPWEEDNVDANNALTFGDGALEGDWRANHKSMSTLIESDPQADELVKGIENLVAPSKNDAYEDPAIVRLINHKWTHPFIIKSKSPKNSFDGRFSWPASRVGGNGTGLLELAPDSRRYLGDATHSTTTPTTIGTACTARFTRFNLQKLTAR